jgi:hypothetical protein
VPKDSALQLFIALAASHAILTTMRPHHPRFGSGGVHPMMALWLIAIVVFGLLATPAQFKSLKRTR